MSFEYKEIDFQKGDELQEKIEYLFLNKKIESVKTNFFSVHITFDDNSKLEISCMSRWDVDFLTFNYKDRKGIK